MRTISAAAAVVLAKNQRAEHLRVLIIDVDDNAQDIDTIAGFPALEEVSISEDIDSPHKTCDITLKREFFDKSLAGLMVDAQANQYTTAYIPLIELNRQVQVYVAVCPMGAQPTAYTMVFQGRIDAIDDASAEFIKLECRDMGGLIADTQIETERAYGYGGPRGARIWAPSTAYAVNEYILPDGKANGHYFKVTTAGTSGATEPTWPGSSTVTSGSAVFTEQGTTSSTGIAVDDLMQQLLDDNLGGVTLDVPSAPTWVIRPYQQQRGKLLESLRELALQIGWDVRYLYRTAINQFDLTFYEPDRAKTTPDATFTPDQYESVNSLRREKMTIRNVIRVIYSDSADLDADGNPRRKYVTVEDATSITTYGRLFMEIAESESSQIDTSSEATDMATAALADLKAPKATQEVSVFYWPYTELGDLYRFTANGRHYSADQDLAVVGYRDSLRANGDGGYSCRTSLTCRGAPSVSHKRWLNVAVDDPYSKMDPDANRHRFQDWVTVGSLAVAVTPIVGGGRIAVSADKVKSTANAGVEVHVSTSSGFTPSSSTLKAVTRTGSTDVADLIPGTTYYTKTVALGLNEGKIVKSSPTTEVSFIAGHAAPGHLNAGYSYVTPLNGDFEAFTQGFATSPDHWSMYGSAAWSDFESYTADTNSGSRSLRFKPTTADQGIQSDLFAVTDGGEYRLSVRYKVRATPAFAQTISAYMEFYQSDGTTSTGNIFALSFIDTVSTTGWLTAKLEGTAPAGSKFAQLILAKSGFVASNPDVLIDAVKFEDKRITQEDWAAPSFSNSWVDFGGAWATVAYMKDSFGFVHIRGLAKSGTTGATMFTLPAGYRPAADELFIVDTNTGIGRCNVLSSGVVKHDAGGNGHFQLSGITFKAA